MIIKTTYQINLSDEEDYQVAIQFEFNSLMEVKSFLKKINDVSLINGTYYKMIIQRVDYSWNVNDGTMNKTYTRLTEDF